jgi:hypothetical protein
MIIESLRVIQILVACGKSPTRVIQKDSPTAKVAIKGERIVKSSSSHKAPTRVMAAQVVTVCHTG